MHAYAEERGHGGYNLIPECATAEDHTDGGGGRVRVVKLARGLEAVPGELHQPRHKGREVEELLVGVVDRAGEVRPRQGAERPAARGRTFQRAGKAWEWGSNTKWESGEIQYGYSFRIFYISFLFLHNMYIFCCETCVCKKFGENNGLFKKGQISSALLSNFTLFPAHRFVFHYSPSPSPPPW